MRAARLRRRSRPPTSPRPTSSRAHRRQTPRRTRSARAASRRAARAPSSSALFVVVERLTGQIRRPLHRLLRTPGAPPSASTASPESSATVGSPPLTLVEVPRLRQRVLLEGRRTPRARPRRTTRRSPLRRDRSTSSPARSEQRPQLAQLARAARREQQRPRVDAQTPSARRCARVELARGPPSRDRAAGRARPRSNVPCSPVPCTSTNRPSLLITTFMSTSARDVFLVVEIEPRLAVDDADAHGRHATLAPAIAAAVPASPASRTRRRTATHAPVIAAVRVPPSACSTSQSSLIGELAELEVVEHRANAAADQALDLLRAPAELRALARRARAASRAAASRTPRSASPRRVPFASRARRPRRTRCRARAWRRTTMRHEPSAYGATRCARARSARSSSSARPTRVGSMFSGHEGAR